MEAIVTPENKLKPDTVLKKFWRNNERFADLFNAVLFDGETVIQPDVLEEVDTDISAVLKLGSYSGTLQKILDVVKKSAYGVDFLILGLENQQNIHYAMPLRIMIGDALGYLKEYDAIAKKNKKAGQWDSREEFLSGLRRTDRLHPMVTICVYYGEREWDGPFSLTDMLDIPERMKPVVNNYKMNLIQVRNSEQFLFHNQDVQTVFDVSRKIFRKNYGELEDVYREREIDSELGIVIGTITESKELIDHALEQKGGRMNMCTALEELKQEGKQEGRQEGKIIGSIETSKKLGASKEKAEKILMEDYGLTVKELTDYMRKYW